MKIVKWLQLDHFKKYFGGFTSLNPQVLYGSSWSPSDIKLQYLNEIERKVHHHVIAGVAGRGYLLKQTPPKSLGAPLPYTNQHPTWKKTDCKIASHIKTSLCCWCAAGGCIAGCWPNRAPGCCIPIMGCCIPIMGCCIPIMGCCIPIMGCCIPIMGCCIPIMGCCIPIMGCCIPIMGCCIPIPGMGCICIPGIPGICIPGIDCMPGFAITPPAGGIPPPAPAGAPDVFPPPPRLRCKQRSNLIRAGSFHKFQPIPLNFLLIPPCSWTYHMAPRPPKHP